MSSVLLEQEQEELLKTLVEASRNVPRDQREDFHLMMDADGSSIMHPGLRGRELRVNKGDVDILDAEGLLIVTHSGRWGFSFVVTPRGPASMRSSSIVQELRHSRSRRR